MSELKLKSNTNTATLKFTGSFDRTVDPANGQIVAWVNFNGTGVVAIRKGFNVSSITDNGTGNYTVNFTISIADADYCVVQNINRADGAVNFLDQAEVTSFSTSAFNFRSGYYAGGVAYIDMVNINLMVVR